MADVEFAATLLGYQGDADDDVRGVAAATSSHGADHEYGVRRITGRRGPRRGRCACPPKVAGAARRVPRRAAARSPRPTRRCHDPRDADRSGSRPRRRARSTSAARAPRCSTGSTPATHGGDVRPAHRGHRRRALTRGVGRRDPGHAALARPRLGRGPVLQSDALRPLPRGRRPAARGRARLRVLLHRGRGEGDATTRAMAAGRPPGLRRPLPRPHRRRAGGARRPRAARARSGSAPPTTA